jgi:2-hydroxy-3-keto-5-methylthiopentenyl-1-phosphate phosphatase
MSDGNFPHGNFPRRDAFVRVYCDFDGTVSLQDATDTVLWRLADPAWQAVEALWRDGAIGSGECMRRQIALIRATPEQLDLVLDEVEIDPFFPAFADFCAAYGIPLTIISDGVDYFIERILSKRGLGHLPVVANRLVTRTRSGQLSYELLSGYGDRTCTSAAGVCKCRWLAAFGEQRIYVGDGRSDFCVSDKPELVFAKGPLAQHCRANDIRFIEYGDFSDVTARLSDAVASLCDRAAATLRRSAAA